jgi:hypothetical protein
VLFRKSDGLVLGAQVAGEEGVARRIDVIATAIQMKATVFDLEEAELCYAPQYDAAKDAVNLAGMIAANALYGDMGELRRWPARLLRLPHPCSTWLVRSQPLRRIEHIPRPPFVETS